MVFWCLKIKFEKSFLNFARITRSSRRRCSVRSSAVVVLMPYRGFFFRVRKRCAGWSKKSNEGGWGWSRDHQTTLSKGVRYTQKHRDSCLMIYLRTKRTFVSIFVDSSRKFPKPHAATIDKNHATVYNRNAYSLIITYERIITTTRVPDDLPMIGSAKWFQNVFLRAKGGGEKFYSNSYWLIMPWRNHCFSHVLPILTLAGNRAIDVCLVFLQTHIYERNCKRCKLFAKELKKLLTNYLYININVRIAWI